MPGFANIRLKEIGAKSALNQSVIPVFLCDSNFRICHKSIGAVKQFPRPIINSSILRHLKKGTDEKISAGGAPMCISFSLPGRDSFAIVTEGCVDGEKYYAFVLEPRILFIPSETPGYISESYKYLSDAVYDLVCSPKASYSRLEACCLRIVRLFNFFERHTFQQISPFQASTNIYNELSAVVAEFSAPLAAIDAYVELEGIVGEHPDCAYPRELIHIFSSVMISAAVMLSRNGYVKLSCRLVDGKRALIEAEVPVSTKSPGKGEIRNFSELSDYAPPLKLELAALMDIAEPNGFTLSCRTDGDRLAISCDIPAHASNTVRLSATAPISEELRRIISDICRLAVEFHGGKN